MSLYTEPTPRTYTASEQSVINANGVKNIVARIGTESNDALLKHLQSWVDGITAVWNAKDAIGNPISPQAVLAELGTNAVTAFQVSSNAAAYILQQTALVHDPATAAKITATVNATLALVKPTTAHPDGTVTVN